MSDNNRDTSSRYGNNEERQQSRNDRNDDGQQRNHSSNENRPDYSDNGKSNQYRNQSRNNSDHHNRQYNNNSMSDSNSNFQNGQGYTPAEFYEGFNQNSSYGFQSNDRDLEQSSSHSDIYTKYLELQVRMLTQASTLQGPSMNSDEFSASQSYSSNSSQLKPTRVYPNYSEFGNGTSSCGSVRPEFIQRTREPAGPNVV